MAWDDTCARSVGALMLLSCDIGQGRAQKGATVLKDGEETGQMAGIHYHDPAREGKTAIKLSSGCVTPEPTIALAPVYQAFSTCAVTQGLKALPVPTLQAKTLYQRCSFPEDLSKV